MYQVEDKRRVKSVLVDKKLNTWTEIEVLKELEEI